MLILKTVGRIYALDLGKDYHNPQCEQVGEIHKHRWPEGYGDRDDIADVWANEDFRLVEPLSTVSRWSRPGKFAAVLIEVA